MKLHDIEAAIEPNSCSADGPDFEPNHLIRIFILKSTVPLLGGARHKWVKMLILND